VTVQAHAGRWLRSQAVLDGKAPKEEPAGKEIVMGIHELFDRHQEIPDVDDCYLVGIWNSESPEDDVDEEEGGHPLWALPFIASKFPALESARMGSDRDSFDYHWPSSGIFRIGCNTYSVVAPVFVRFRWGAGHPDAEGVEMLPHEADAYGRWCKHCGAETVGVPRDCPTLRLRALAATTDRLESHRHRMAVKSWHKAKP